MSVTIVVKKRSDDFKAEVRGKSEIWGRGKTQVEAVGDLITSHPDAFPSVRVETETATAGFTVPANREGTPLWH